MAVQLERPTRLLRACATAHYKCQKLLKPIMEEVRALSTTDLGQYDACGLSKPIYSVAALIARSPTPGDKVDFHVCLEVLRQTRWAYSDHEKRVADLRFLWNASRSESRGEPSETSFGPILRSPSPTKSARSQGSSGRVSSDRVSSSRASSSRVSSGPMSSGRVSSDRVSTGRVSSGRVSSVRGSSGVSSMSFCIPEGHNSPDDDGPSRKTPSRLAKVLRTLRGKEF